MKKQKVPLAVLGMILFIYGFSAIADERGSYSVSSSSCEKPRYYCGGLCEEYRPWRLVISAGLMDSHVTFAVSGRGCTASEARTEMHEDCDGTLSQVYCD